MNKLLTNGKNFVNLHLRHTSIYRLLCKVLTPQKNPPARGGFFRLHAQADARADRQPGQCEDDHHDQPYSEEDKAVRQHQGNQSAKARFLVIFTHEGENDQNIRI